MKLTMSYFKKVIISDTENFYPCGACMKMRRCLSTIINNYYKDIFHYFGMLEYIIWGVVVQI